MRGGLPSLVLNLGAAHTEAYPTRLVHGICDEFLAAHSHPLTSRLAPCSGTRFAIVRTLRGGTYSNIAHASHGAQKSP